MTDIWILIIFGVKRSVKKIVNKNIIAEDECFLWLSWKRC